MFAIKKKKIRENERKEDQAKRRCSLSTLTKDISSVADEDGRVNEADVRDVLAKASGYDSADERLNALLRAQAFDEDDCMDSEELVGGSSALYARTPRPRDLVVARNYSRPGAPAELRGSSSDDRQDSKADPDRHREDEAQQPRAPHPL